MFQQAHRSSGLTVTQPGRPYPAPAISKLPLRSVVSITVNRIRGKIPILLFNTYSYTFANNPKTGVRWTVNDIKGTVSGNELQQFGVLSTDLSPDVWFGRAHVQRGVWEVILGGTERECLTFLQQLSVSKTPHLFHYSGSCGGSGSSYPVAAWVDMIQNFWDTRHSDRPSSKSQNKWVFQGQTKQP